MNIYVFSQLNFMLDNEKHEMIPIGQLVKLDTLLYSHNTPTSSNLLYNLLRKLVGLGCLLKDIRKEYESCINSSFTYNSENEADANVIGNIVNPNIKTPDNKTDKQKR